MKIQINGFDIEIETSDTEMMIKVIDANGQELSNNTYTQTLDTTDDVEDVVIPGVDEFGDDELEDEFDDELGDDELGDDELEDDELDVEDDEEDDITFDENKVYNFKQYKKLSEANKIKLNKRR